MKVIPFFVVDRPISLKIINCFFTKYYHREWGILTHVFTSSNFKEKFKNFPESNPCSFFSRELPKRELKRIYKIVDSGIFISKKDISYEKLFEQYENLNSDFGVIIDYLKDKKKHCKVQNKLLKFIRRINILLN